MEETSSPPYENPLLEVHKNPPDTVSHVTPASNILTEQTKSNRIFFLAYVAGN